MKFSPERALFGNPYDRNRNGVYCEFFPQGGLEGLVVRVDDNVR